MLVSHKHKFIFLKTTKTAGTSVEAYLQPLCVPEGHVFSGKTPLIETDVGIVGARGREFVEGQRYWSHMPASTLKNYLPEGLWDDYFKFTIVRNPFDRMVSAFWFRLRSNIELVAELQVRPFELTKKKFKSWVSKKRPSDRHIYVIDGQVIADKLIRYENLESDVKEVCDIIGCHPPGKIPRLKGGHRIKPEHYSNYYDQECREIVEEEFEFELKTFGYSFEAEG